MTAPGATEAVEALEALRVAVSEADVVCPVGGRTQWDVGGEPVPGAPVAAPGGIVRHDPADLTVTVLAGTPVADLDAALGEVGQECVLGPAAPGATVGGVLACGLSGYRRLRHGPVRDRVLEVRFVTGDGRLVKGGGPTVKNVTGYDLPRLMVGSLGTLGVIGQVTLRCTPAPPTSTWAHGDVDPFALRRSLHRPACIAWDGSHTWCLLEGHPSDVETQMAATGVEAGDPPPWPHGLWRGRISVRPAAIDAVVGDLEERSAEEGLGLAWMAEVGVGTVHVAAQAVEGLAAAREVATAAGGWLLREAGDGIDGFGRPLPNLAVMRRLKEAFDPQGRLNPGRLPL